MALHKQNRGASDITRQLSIARSTVYKILSEINEVDYYLK